ncbi:MAG: NADH:ubiquinone reductase (Na(+)-transporting) subunit A [Crocinitomicaceae bacterium]|nr:NADH:ubiquinone reductase (Na(+)-transporting) subunit A [Crocinitomicaceae bacterium]|tara:strand:+ start:6801 stop:8153 length:1353 start_codon:yes stop_codon:yes gene_type:complete
MKVIIKKGLNINLEGPAEKIIKDGEASKLIAIQPSDFPGLTPKMLIKEGEPVLCGAPIFFDKYNDVIKFVSPVSGILKSIERGAKRKITSIIIESDGKMTQASNSVTDLAKQSREDVISSLLNGGLWPLIRMRPIDIIAQPTDKPKSIFISAFDSNPLSPDYDFIMHGKDSEFNAGIEVLKKLTDGPINLQIRSTADDVFKNAKNVEINTVFGPHPAGNVGVQIHKIDTINKGDIVWYINPQDVMIIGRFALTGTYDASRVIAVAGANVSERNYIKTLPGSQISSIISSKNIKDNSRLISGNPLTGNKVSLDGFLGFYHQQITVLPEGNQYKFFLTEGWLGAGFKRFSASKAYPTWLMPKSKVYNIDTNLNGEERAFVVSGEYEKVFPFDIYPVHLLKSIITNDIEKMENLGIYEISPEDFALCEFVCTSKINVQSIVREGLDLVYKECM